MSSIVNFQLKFRCIQQLYWLKTRRTTQRISYCKCNQTTNPSESFSSHLTTSIFHWLPFHFVSLVWVCVLMTLTVYIVNIHAVKLAPRASLKNQVVEQMIYKNTKNEDEKRFTWLALVKLFFFCAIDNYFSVTLRLHDTCLPKAKKRWEKQQKMW
jgi:hypothetical protein